MIRLRKDISPSKAILKELGILQQEINSLKSFKEQNVSAKKLFKQKNTKTNPVFKEVRISISELCNRTRRCVYCEDSLADEIEHIYPKDLFPEKCFKWENYIYACGPCNGPKNNKFAIFRNSDGEFIIINPPKGISAKKPPKGIAVMINPREENAMDFVYLDLSPGSFLFVPKKSLNLKDNKRAVYTFDDILHLNEPEREPTRQAREDAYGMYQARLFQYTQNKKNGTDKAKLDKMIEGIKMEAHATVWKEMQRQHIEGNLKKIDADVDDLFINSPEALEW